MDVGVMSHSTLQKSDLGEIIKRTIACSNDGPLSYKDQVSDSASICASTSSEICR